MEGDEKKPDATDPYADRKKLTFEQAEGAEPLPSQLKPKELTKHLRALLWEAIYNNLERSRHSDIDGVDQLLSP